MYPTRTLQDCIPGTVPLLVVYVVVVPAVRAWETWVSWDKGLDGFFDGFQNNCATFWWVLADE
jgi:hypothetical protein